MSNIGLRKRPASSTEGRDPNSLPDERVIQRRIGLIWILLFFNGLPWVAATVIPVPPAVARPILAGALVVAFLLAVSINPELTFRPNVVLSLFTVLAVLALITGVRGMAGPGAVFRAFRFLGFLSVLWLLTPWWGRRDMLLARCHLRALLIALGTVLAGLLISPTAALKTEGRLVGALWPIPATQVAEFAAVVAGMGIVLWLSGSIAPNRALLLGSGGIVLIIHTHTRTAVIALAIGLVSAGLTLLLSHRRVRRALVVIAIGLPLGLITLTPAISSWFAREQSSEQINALTGRKEVWAALMDAPRPEFNRWFGLGLSDKSFQGRPIDSTWYSVYQEVGLVGVAIVAAILLFLLIAQAFCRAGPRRALAMFLVVYCCVASYTEVGLGDASPYVLHIAVAASLIAPELRRDVHSLALTNGSSRRWTR